MMSDAPQLEAYCLSKPSANAGFPFGEEVLVIKLLDKIFALITVGSQKPAISLKCHPHLAGDLRRDYPAIKPGYHLNKQHWNTVELDGTVPEKELHGMIDHSYDRVLNSLKKADREKVLVP